MAKWLALLAGARGEPGSIPVIDYNILEELRFSDKKLPVVLNWIKFFLITIFLKPPTYFFHRDVHDLTDDLAAIIDKHRRYRRSKREEREKEERERGKQQQQKNTTDV